MLIFSRPMAEFTAGTGSNPFVIRLNHFGHIIIGQDFGRQIVAKSDKFRSNKSHKEFPEIISLNQHFQVHRGWC